MMKIILATDFSDYAQNAIDYALFLLKDKECTFYLLHAFHYAPSAPITKLTRTADLKQLIHHAETHHNNPNHRFEMVIETDTVVNLVSRTAIDNSADYIFVGTRGYSTLHEVLWGSNTVDLFKHLECACPIVAVPKDYEFDLPKEILLASDFQHRFIEPELAPLIRISKLWDSSLTVLHIQTEKELSNIQIENKELLKTTLKDTRLKFEKTTMGNSIAATLYQLERKNPQIGMVALLNTKHGFLKNLLREPIIKNMSFQTKVPLLVLPQIAEY